jgi:hypothetical protein
MMPTDLPEVFPRKSNVQAQTQTEIVAMLSVWIIIFLITLVLLRLVADQSFSNPTTEWEYLF